MRRHGELCTLQPCDRWNDGNYMLEPSAIPRVRPEQVSDIVNRTCPTDYYRAKRVLLIVPDGTRTAPVGLLFHNLYRQIGQATKTFDVLIALGTHQPMSDTAICRRLEITEQQRRDKYGAVKFFNHAWDNPAALKQ